MTRTNLTNPNQTSNPKMKTFFHSLYLTRSKLLIRYSKGGERHSLTYNPLEACKLLEDMGYIDGYIVHDGKPVILEEASWCYPHSQTGEPVEVNGYNDVEWKEFVKSFNKKTLKDRYWIGKALFNWIILQWEAEEYRKKIYSIPSLVSNIAS